MNVLKIKSRNYFIIVTSLLISIGFKSKSFAEDLTFKFTDLAQLRKSCVVPEALNQNEQITIENRKPLFELKFNNVDETASITSYFYDSEDKSIRKVSISLKDNSITEDKAESARTLLDIVTVFSTLIPAKILAQEGYPDTKNENLSFWGKASLPFVSFRDIVFEGTSGLVNGSVDLLDAVGIIKDQDTANNIRLENAMRSFVSSLKVNNCTLDLNNITSSVTNSKK